MKVKSSYDRSGLDKLMASLRKMQGEKLEWGFYSEDTYNDSRGFTNAAQVAKAVEEGHENGGWFPDTYTPARPFFSTALLDQANHAELRRAIKNLQRRVLKGTISVEYKMQRLGEIVVRQVRDSISNYASINNYVADTTIDVRLYRGISSTEPLMETGTLYNSVRAKINGKPL